MTDSVTLVPYAIESHDPYPYNYKTCKMSFGLIHEHFL